MVIHMGHSKMSVCLLGVMKVTFSMELLHVHSGNFCTFVKIKIYKIFNKYNPLLQIYKQDLFEFSICTNK